MSVSGLSAVAIGDLVLASGEAPVGEVEAVLPTSRGTQLVLKRAFFPGVYLVAQAEGIEASEEDPELGLRWHRLCASAEGILGRGRFRRVMGRLTPDPYPSLPPPPLDDAAAAKSIARALAADPLIGPESGEVQVRVSRGAGSLRGWVRLVGLKVTAEQLARSTPGVWYVRNWLFSDDELRGAAMRWIREQPALAARVRDVKVSLGHATITLSHPAAGTTREAIQALRGEPGIRGLELREESSH